jgi:anti-sigma factor RsiW
MSVSENQLVRRYLLGLLADAEREAVEERLFDSPDFLPLVEAVEGELMDEYVDGSLPAADRKRWEAYLSAHPESRDRLQFARALHGHFAAKRPAWKRLLPVLAIAAALLVAILLWERRETSPAPGKQPVVFAMVLNPGTLRSAGEQSQTMTIPPAAEIVRIDFRSPGAVKAVVRLIDTGNAVWTGEAKQGVAELRAPMLANGDYVATTFDAAGEELADYTFRVRR